MGLGDLPEVLTAQHIASYLHISRRRVYELFQMSEAAGGIRNFDVGNSKRVDKQDFIRWMESRKEEKAKSVVS
ncbi:helix-turn-helix domain-containing protein [Ammoniphilus sp. YIM 78166]|uniref:helix-turn-helix domain-containing protein n=1 Tax=Ammoniphilus sp. YIM 78166 TaxID=1644106 RepID=UPI00106FC566|nr:helix-turn-helix domain-containing protein [Ammoniphilus sp. YIM 78166]